MSPSASSVIRGSGPRHWWTRYLLAVTIVAAATLLRALVDPWIHDQIPYFIYVASVVVATWFCGVDGGIFSTLLSAVLGNYFFVTPRYDPVPQREDWIAMAMFSAVGGGLVWLVGRWKAAERELRQQATSLEALKNEAERVSRVKDEFLATLSHELRTPLNAIVGWAHLLQSEALDPARSRAAAETILRNAEAQARLVDDLLDVSRIVSGKLHLLPGVVDLAEVVSTAVEMVRHAADAKEIQLSTSLEPGAILVGDADRLRQVVWNLLSNAVKFTRRKGRVDVRLERDDSHLRLTVSDTGVGIAPQFLPQLFDRFSQADSSTTRRHGGLGLGLAIVRHLVELHGGTVSAASPGAEQGSVFTLTLPVRAVTELPAPVLVEQRGRETSASAFGPLALRGIRVLVVDDEADARELVGAVLAQYGAEVRVASSAVEGFCDVRAWRPDVLVADIGMPVEDGYALLRRVRSLPASEGGLLPAAALTAYAQAADRQRALAAGFQEHVAKPVSPERLAEVVTRLAQGAPGRVH